MFSPDTLHLPNSETPPHGACMTPAVRCLCHHLSFSETHTHGATMVQLWCHHLSFGFVHPVSHPGHPPSSSYGNDTVEKNSDDSDSVNNS